MKIAAALLDAVTTTQPSLARRTQAHWPLCFPRWTGHVSRLSPSLCGRMPDAVIRPPAWSLYNAGSECVSPACLPVWMPDAVTLVLGSRLPLALVSLPLVFCVSQSLRSAVMLGAGSCLPPLPPNLCVWPSDARCCDAVAL